MFKPMFEHRFPQLPSQRLSNWPRNCIAYLSMHLIYSVNEACKVDNAATHGFDHIVCHTMKFEMVWEALRPCELTNCDDAFTLSDR